MQFAHGCSKVIHFAAAAVMMSVATSSAEAGVIYTDWSRPAAMSFSAMSPPDPYSIIGDVTSGYMWYGPNGCGDNGGICDGSYAGPDAAEFRYRFRLPSAAEFGYPQYLGASTLSIAADDYFALYVNGHLLTPQGVWHDDVGDHAMTFELASYLTLGAENEILIFACDGYKPVNGDVPGPNAQDGFGGCSNYQDRVNNWVLTAGRIQVEDNTFGGAINFFADLASTNPDYFPETVWEVRGASIPEPSLWSLMLVAALGGVFARRAGARLHGALAAVEA